MAECDGGVDIIAQHAAERLAPRCIGELELDIYAMRDGLAKAGLTYRDEDGE